MLGRGRLPYLTVLIHSSDIFKQTLYANHSAIDPRDVRLVLKELVGESDKYSVVRIRIKVCVGAYGHPEETQLNQTGSSKGGNVIVQSVFLRALVLKNSPWKKNTSLWSSKCGKPWTLSLPFPKSQSQSPLAH